MTEKMTKGIGDLDSSEQDLVKCINRAVMEANEIYYKWSNGYFLDAYGVEAFMVSQIAREIMREPSMFPYLTLEARLNSEIRDFCGVGQFKGQDFPKKHPFGTKGRVDVALYDENELLQHIIEAKLYWAGTSLSDIDRLSTLTNDIHSNDGKNFKSGIYVQFITSEREKNLKGRIGKWASDNKWLEAHVKKIGMDKKLDYYYCPYSGEPFKDPKSGWLASSLCLVIKPKS